MSDATARLIGYILKMSHDDIMGLLDLVEKIHVRNKRKSQRLDHHGETTYVMKGKVYTGFTRNISTSGVFIDTPDVADAGESILLSCDMPMGKSLRTSGAVVREEAQGFAVTFDQAITTPLSV